jgi:hypothetical protein
MRFIPIVPHIPNEACGLSPRIRLSRLLMKLDMNVMEIRDSLFRKRILTEAGLIQMEIDIKILQVYQLAYVAIKT